MTGRERYRLGTVYFGVDGVCAVQTLFGGGGDGLRRCDLIDTLGLR